MAKPNWQRRTVALIKKVGAELTVNINDALYLDVCVDAPEGKVWCCSFIHCLVGATDRYPTASDKEEMWKDLYERMRYGLADCDDEACETCHEEPQ